MSYPMRIRALQKGDITAITAIVSHPMETGLRKDDGGKVVPAHFIQSLTVDVGGRRVVDSRLNTAVSANPVFNFKIAGAKVGDKVALNWQDNLGERGSGDTVVAAS
ncbi:MAG TPA: thiosulfate oxidation carrier complex protein SoxZ [Rhodocyclaceae bacterium]|nr:thiosulfate oxidation carrier complex protein SoxZ [Rhodocyclaceae bacterium]